MPNSNRKTSKARRKGAHSATGRSPQLAMLKLQKSAYGGELLNTRTGRSHGRPLSTTNSMHLVLRSTLARGDWSFRQPRNEKGIRRILEKFAFVYGVRVLSKANVGNHLHIHIRLGNRHAYAPFIRSVTGAIAMLVTGRSRWSKVNAKRPEMAKAANGPRSDGFRGENGEATFLRRKFWDYRPYTRVVESLRAILKLRDYIEINRLEGFGLERDHARYVVENRTYMRLE